MSAPIHANEIIISCVTENTPRMLAQTRRLLRSIRWFGGELAQSRIQVCAVGAIERSARRTFEEDLGAEIRIVSRFHPNNPTANRLQSFLELQDVSEELLLMLDCDTIVVQDPLPLLRRDAFQAKIAPVHSVTHEVFEQLFAHFGLPLPPRSHVTPFTGVATIPYYNAGVMAIPKTIAAVLAPSWRKFNAVLAANPSLAGPSRKHIHQASLSLALAETGVPRVDLPHAMNFQLNTAEMTPPPGFVETDPVIIHYHHLVGDDERLMACPYPEAQKRIDAFNARLGVPAGTGVRDARPPIVVLGMHRSGTSVVAEVLHAMGAYAGRADELMPPDLFNPTGYWEHLGIQKLNEEVLSTLSASWLDVEGADLSRLTPEQHASFVDRARELAAPLTLIKDPRMSLLFPLWREALHRPQCVIVWRDPLAVARSLSVRDRLPLPFALAVWEHYNRAILAATSDLPRMLISYDDLIADPVRVSRELQSFAGLTPVDEERLRQIVNVDFDRSRRRAEESDELLTAEQRALRDALRSGDALQGVPEMSVSARALIAAFVVNLQEKETSAKRIAQLEQLLDATFGSRSWRIGNTLVRLLGRKKQPSAAERWARMRR